MIAGAPMTDNFALTLEREGLIVLAGQRFALTTDETDLLSPRFSDGRAKNISLGPGGGVRGAARDPFNQGRLAALMARYRSWARTLIKAEAPRYAPWLELGRTSLRTREVAEGSDRPRGDDRRLHVDAFASQPTGGRRILRVFTNINPDAEPRIWWVGEPFAAHAQRWVGRLRGSWLGEAWLLSRLGVTRATRTPYDTLMLGLHDASKLDDLYQREGPRREVAFPAGSSWTVYTDSTVHAAIRGQFCLEQTFYLPLEAMADPQASPARILERMVGRRLC